jgi:acyl-CoA thioesterase
MTQSGIDLLKGAVGSDLDGAFTRLLGIRLEAAEVGSVRLSCAVTADHANIMGRAHGGFAAALIDTAMGCAVMSSLNPYVPFGTVQLNLHFVRKIDIENNSLSCEAKAVHTGRTMITVEARLTDAAGELCAHGTGTFLVYPS